MSQHNNAAGGYLPLLPQITITTPIAATAGTVMPVLSAGISGEFANRAGKLTQAKYLVVQAVFTFGSGGTSVDAYIQTSLDLGGTWIDVMEFNFLVASATKISAVVFTTALAAAVAPTDGTLASNSIVNGLLGDRFRVKYKSAGTYAGGTTLSVTGFAKG